MTKKHSPVICDGCGADITTTGNSVDYRLVLHAESPTPWFIAEGMSGGVMTDMMIYPAVKHAHHFCNTLECLRAWLAGPEAVAERRAKREARYASANPLPR